VTVVMVVTVKGMQMKMVRPLCPNTMRAKGTRMRRSISVRKERHLHHPAIIEEQVSVYIGKKLKMKINGDNLINIARMS
jgi:hypothetical protein